MSSSSGSAILLYDGACGLCAGSVQFVLGRERSHDLRFAPLAGATGMTLKAVHPELAGVDSMIWYEPATGRVRIRSDAALAAARYLGGGWTVLATVAALVPRALRDRVYDMIARHRHRLAGPVCVVPTAEQRGRFLDLDRA